MKNEKSNRTKWQTFKVHIFYFEDIYRVIEKYYQVLQFKFVHLELNLKVFAFEYDKK